MLDILLEASQIFGVSVKDIVRHRRTRTAVEARQAVVYVARQRTNLSLVQIGEALGGRDHTTIMWAVEAAERRAIGDYNYALQLAALL